MVKVEIEPMAENTDRVPWVREQATNLDVLLEDGFESLVNVIVAQPSAAIFLK